jgi:hypothetical protein
LYLLNESQDHLALSRLHPMLTLVPGYLKGICDVVSGFVVLTMTALAQIL